METAEFLRALETEGRLLAAAAEEAGTGAKVPTCPEWQVRDLLRHTGAVHRWAAAFVAERLTERRPLVEPTGLDGAELIAWYRDSHHRLVGTLADASPDVECFTFLPAPSPLAFWARRQAHETAVHRVDAESARGAAPTDVTPEFATDGIDELLRGFHARSRSRVRTPEPRVLRIRTEDTGAVWTLRLSPEPPVTTRDDSGEAECELSAPAGQLYLALWNRAPLPAATGDQALATMWRETSAI
ncbi:maleylpyruvate isomerase family mycothiol-dependent enzyme [Streptomyces sp. NPDC056373]|uniref:maleylpyruvate isomerase family mycothiol-dependent enzyme n=1 Tax=Streptomyces sp. NPDC056373 TaxID=3345798 RepID=UPI0035E1C186